MFTTLKGLVLEARSGLANRAWRHGIRMEMSPQITNRLWADGYRFEWRIRGNVAMGHTLAGERVTLPIEEFVRRYFT